MEINEETYRLFDRYFTDDLSAEERMDFEKALSVDEKFRGEFQWLSIALSEIRMNGRSILKKQLAEIGAAIPASAFEKYTPSIKPKNFFKKWWWAIAVIVAAAGLTIAWLARGPEGYHLNLFSEPSHADYVRMKEDFKESMQKDTATASPFGAPQTPGDTMNAKPVSIGECCSYSVRAGQRSNFLYGENPDSVYRWYDVGPSSAAISETILTVECCPQKGKPAFYTYANRITLSAAYADTSGLRFFQHGNELMMTDGKPGYFILTKGEKEKPLVRVNPEALKGVIHENGKSKPKPSMKK
jgi:hypothetical protein